MLFPSVPNYLRLWSPQKCVVVDYNEVSVSVDAKLLYCFITWSLFELQMLLDVVTVFNEVSSIAQKQQSIKITQDGIEVP